LRAFSLTGHKSLDAFDAEGLKWRKGSSSYISHNAFVFLLLRNVKLERDRDAALYMHE